MTEKFIFFYGGTTGNGVFSQWYQPSFFTVDDVEYNCAEQFMMAEKARLFGDEETLKKIMLKTHPKDQKALGKSVTPFNATEWNAVARDRVYEGNYAKFTQDSRLKERLLITHGTTLVEASPYDTIWGIGRTADDPLAWSRETWRGTNWLGEVLTKLCNDLVSGVKSTVFDWKN